METYRVELSTELENLVSLTTRVLRERPDGYPPSLFGLLIFMLSSAGYLLTRGHRYDVVHFGDLLLFPLAWLHARSHPRKARFITVHGLDLLYGNRFGLAPSVYRSVMAWTRRNAKLIHGYLANSNFHVGLVIRTLRLLNVDNLRNHPLLNDESHHPDTLPQ